MFSTDTKILIVDDVEATRESVALILRRLGYYHLTEAVDGVEAWEKAKNGEFGLIISDWQMPNCSGFELLRKIREDKLTAKTPFLLATVDNDVEMMIEAFMGGVDQLLIKPYCEESMIYKLNLIFAKYVTS